jgi:hypothetical protein
MRRSPFVVVVAGLAAACGSSEPHAPGESAPIVAPAPFPAPSPSPSPSSPARRWIAGDLHMHVAPIDAREGQMLDVDGLAREGRAAGLEFVVATPHLHRSTWSDRAKRRDWKAKWSAMATAARARSDLTIIPGVEWTVWGYGHFSVSGTDLAAIEADNFLADATTRGAFVVVNHPFAVPTRIPGIPISERDLSFRPWTDGRGALPPRIDGVEVWNFPLALANLASAPGGQTGEQRAFAAADHLARRERRRVAVVGGSDSHSAFMMPTTWVLATDASEAAILAGLRDGATCVGGI